MDFENTNVKYTVKFYLRPTGHIYLSFTYNNQRLIQSTREKVSDEDFWNSEKQEARNTVKNPKSKEINKNLNEIKSVIGKLYEDFLTNHNRLPEPAELSELFKNEYFEKIPQFTTQKKKSLIEAFREYIDSKRIDNTESTAVKYEQALNTLIDFGRHSRTQIQFENITMDFRNKFVKYLQANMGYADSTIYRKLKFVKTVLIYSINNGYINKIPMNLDNFLTKDKPGTHIALSEYELSEIEDLDLTDNPKLDKVRDRFLIGCYTGLRFSDFIRLNKNHIQDDEYIIIRMKKTDDNITIPITDNVRQIFEKYEYNLPAPISEVKFNEYLKQVTAKCKSLLRLQEATQYIGGKEKKVNTPRYKLVSTHTARRTFVTLNHAKGIDLETLTIATGHTTVKALKTYVKLNNQQKADILKREFERVNKRDAEEVKIIKLNA